MSNSAVPNMGGSAEKMAQGLTNGSYLASQLIVQVKDMAQLGGLFGMAAI